MMHKFLFLFLICFGLNELVAQVVTEESPASFYSPIPENTQIEVISIDAPNLLQLAKQDAVEDKIKDIPWRFGVETAMDIGLLERGNWIDHGNGQSTWLIKIKADQAKSINLNFAEFHLNETSKLFIYNASRSDLLGAITHKNNKVDGAFSIRPIKGDEIILELNCPTASKFENRLKLSGVVYGYRSIHEKAAKAFGTSGNCNINVNCKDGDLWQDIKRSVVMILRGNNTRWCSGSLINNVRQDSTPYILTANHCGLQNNSIFIFNYESPNCSPNSDGTLIKSISGAFSRATHSNSDFHLFELSTKPPLNYNVYYAGWDAQNIASTHSTVIHHPDGDVKKISHDYDTLITSGYYSTAGTSHWTLADYETGTTEGGSSGSPLFNEYQRIIGQLHGGDAACGNEAQDYYGKFSTSWDNFTNSNQQLKFWLDPDSTGILTLDGLNPNPSALSGPFDIGIIHVFGINRYACLDSVFTPSVIVKNFGSSSIMGFQLKFDSYASVTGKDSLMLTDTLESGEALKINLPSQTYPNGKHRYHVSASILNDANAINDTISEPLLINLHPIYINFRLKTDNYGNETSWRISEGNPEVKIHEGGPYPQQGGGAIFNRTLCLYDSCFSLRIFDSAGDGFNDVSGSFGNGYILITDVQGDTLLFENQFYSSVKKDSFCVINPSTGILKKTEKIFNVKIYPNPVKAGNTILLQSMGKLQYQLYDLSGKLLLEGIETEIQIPHGIKPALYLLKLIDSDRRVLIKKIAIY